MKEEREYVMLNECKLNDSCKSGNMGVKVCRVCVFIVNVTDHDINKK
jgi:hypothetical protein